MPSLQSTGITGGARRRRDILFFAVAVGVLALGLLNSGASEGNFSAGNGMEMVYAAPLGGWVGKYLVTQAQYQAVMGDNPSVFVNPRGPVDSVRWGLAMDYCKKLTERDHKSGVLPADEKYDLPTNDEYDIFVGDASLADAVTSLYGYQPRTEPVGSRHPNEYGLYDTRGNVWEWTRDKYDIIHGWRVLRGGSWVDNDPKVLVVSYRASSNPGKAPPPGVPELIKTGYGFRVVVVKA